MKNLYRVIQAELMKAKRTLALWMVGIAPLSIVALFTLLIGADAMDPAKIGWEIIGRNAINMWAFFMLPLFIALETALLSGIDHKEGGWKRLYALPISRWTVYGAKLLIVLVFIGLSSLILVGGLGALFVILQYLPWLNLPAAAVPWLAMLQWVGYAYLGAWLILVIHHWISMRWASFTVALGVAVAVTMGIIQIASSKWWVIYPWTYPLTAASASEPDRQMLALGISLAGGLVVALLAGWTLTRRDVL